MSNFLYKLKNWFNLKYRLKKFITRLIWIFGCCAFIFAFVPSQKASARSSYNYYRGDMSYNVGGGDFNATGIYTRDDYMFYSFNSSGSTGFIQFSLNDGLLRGSYNRLVVSVWSIENISESEFSFFPSRSVVSSRSHSGYTDLTTGVNFHYDNSVSQSSRKLGFSSVFDLSSVGSNVDISSIWIEGSGTLPPCYVSIYLYNDSGSNDISALINAVNLQTSILDDSIQNGNGSTQSTINGSQSDLDSTINQFDNTNDKLIQYDDIESGFITDYDGAMDGIDSTVKGFTFDGILPAARWLSTQMTSRYNSMSDFKFFVIFPVIFAIALVMIGGSIGKRF